MKLLRDLFQICLQVRDSDHTDENGSEVTLEEKVPKD